MENLFIIGYGLSGGYGGIHDYEVIEAENLEEAENAAYYKACEYYDMYIDGINLRDTDHIMEEDEVDEETAYEIFCEERENWLDYTAVEYNEKNLKEVEGYHLNNPFEK